MNPIKRRFYYDSEGFVFFEVNLYGETTIDKDIADFKALSERNRDTFDVIELAFGEYAQDFAECNGYRVNPATKALEFSYPDATQPDAEPVYVKPLSEEVRRLDEQQTLMQSALDELIFGGAV